MKIDIKKFPKALFLFVLIFMINLIVSKKHPENYVFDYHLEDYQKATSVTTVAGSSASGFILVGFIILLISIINWAITKKFKWCYSDWMLLLVVLIEILKLYRA